MRLDALITSKEIYINIYKYIIKRYHTDKFYLVWTVIYTNRASNILDNNGDQ